MEVAAADGFVRIFVDQGDDVLELLDLLMNGKVALSQDAEELLARIQTAAGKRNTHCQQVGHTKLRSASAHLVESLTKREARILELLSSGSSNREIAGMTFISEQTVKWHLHNIFGKLGVANRTRAVAVARQLQENAGSESADILRRNR